MLVAAGGQTGRAVVDGVPDDLCGAFRAASAALYPRALKRVPTQRTTTQRVCLGGQSNGGHRFFFRADLLLPPLRAFCASHCATARAASAFVAARFLVCETAAAIAREVE